MADRAVSVWRASKRFPPGAAGRPLTDDDYDVLLVGDTDVYSPSGKRVACYRRNVVSAEAADTAYPFLRKIAMFRSMNRGLASGGLRRKPIKKDGTVSKTTVTLNRETGKAMPVPSAIYGYFDRAPRFPFCRQTSFLAKQVEPWAAVRPLLDQVAAVFADAVPDRHAVQMAHADRTHPDFRIAGTPWTTMTVNKSWPTAMHKDAGDLDAGFSCLVVLRKGQYDGCRLVLPEFRVAVDLRHGDVLYFNAHEWHGNTPMTKGSDDAERVSVVLYFRTEMVDCGSAASELQRAKARGMLPT